MRLLAALALLLLATGCAAPAPPRQPAAHPTAPPTIVSLNPCADAILAEIAAPGQLLAVSHYSHDRRASSMPRADALAYRATGGTVEEVLALDPDLVVADSFMPPATRRAFARLGLPVVTLGIAATLDDSVAQVRALARAARRGPQGEALAARIVQAWEAAAYTREPVETLLWQAGGIVAGDATLAAAMLRQAGFASHSSARGLGQGAYLPLEQVLADPPALVLAAGEERALAYPVLRRIEGVAYQRLDPALLYCGGPTIIRAMARLRDIRASLP